MSNSEHQDAELSKLEKAGLAPTVEARVERFSRQIQNLQNRISGMDVTPSMNTNMNIGNFMEEILGIQAEIVALLGKLGRA